MNSKQLVQTATELVEKYNNKSAGSEDQDFIDLFQLYLNRDYISLEGKKAVVKIKEEWQIDYMAWRPGNNNSRDGGQVFGDSEEDVRTKFERVKMNLAAYPPYEVYSAVMVRPDDTRVWLIGG